MCVSQSWEDTVRSCGKYGGGELFEYPNSHPQALGLNAALHGLRPPPTLTHIKRQFGPSMDIGSYEFAQGTELLRNEQCLDFFQKYAYLATEHRK